MVVSVDGKEMALKKKERKVGSEAPSARVKMADGQEKVIGMMADKVQAFITVNGDSDLSDELLKITQAEKENALIYVISSKDLSKDLDSGFTATDFLDFSTKFGVNISDTLTAKSLFIVNKDGEIVYREVVKDLTSAFNTAEFGKVLEETIAFKKKGHTHEDWMRY